MTQVVSSAQPPRLPPPLTVADDMAPDWRSVDTDFDTAANMLVRAHQQDGESKDLPVLNLRSWAAVALRNHKIGLQPLAGHHPPYVLRSNAFSNLAVRLGAPAEFVRDKLTAPLQVATLNYLLSQHGPALSGTLRLRGKEVSAIVSGRYAPLDAEELVETVRDALVEQGALDSVRVKALATGVTDVMRLTFPSEQEAVNVGDVSAVGLDISTSCFGRSAIHVKGLLWRLVCENGLRVAERHGGFSFRHVGDSDRLRAGVTEAIPSVLAEARGTMRMWRESVAVMVEQVADVLGGMRELTQVERGRVETELKQGGPELPESTSAYNLVNAVTRAAHSSEPARRLELESFAGGLLRERMRAA